MTSAASVLASQYLHRFTGLPFSDFNFWIGLFAFACQVTGELAILGLLSFRTATLTACRQTDTAGVKAVSACDSFAHQMVHHFD